MNEYKCSELANPAKPSRVVRQFLNTKKELQRTLFLLGIGSWGRRELGIGS
uniref:Uncharacterized protein n=1 Tax=Desertifilum tharense IPPAS B-1220 TaxID=1781255 RepID=A0ACD5H324_9CYAN